MIDIAKFSILKSAPASPDEAQGVCIANISPLERQKRMRFGIQQFIIALLVLGVMIAVHLSPLWRLSLLLLFWTAGIGYFQARDKT